MSESQVIGGTGVDMPEEAPAKRTMDKGFLRNMKIIIGVVIAFCLVVGVFVVNSFGGSKKGNEAVSVNPGMSAGQLKVGEDQTPAMQDKLRAQQLADAERARQEGRSYIPQDAVGKTIPVEPAKDPSIRQTSMPMPVPTDSTMQYTMNSIGVSGSGSRQDADMRKALETQMANIFPSVVAQGNVRQSISRDGGAAGGAPAQSSAAAAQSVAAGAPALSQTTSAPLIQALEIHTGKLSNPITAIKGKPAYSSALITSGPFAGAFLTGTSTLNDVETIDTVYTAMRFGNKAYRIDAIVLDEQTADAGMRGDVDRRLLQRYALPIAVAMAQGYFAAAAQTGTQVISGTGGVLGTQTPAPTEEQALNAGKAAAMGIIQKDVQQAAQQPIRASVPSQMHIGILFRAPVKEEIK